MMNAEIRSIIPSTLGVLAYEDLLQVPVVYLSFCRYYAGRSWGFRTMERSYPSWQLVQN